MIIRDYKYTPEDVDCRYCTKFAHNRCTVNVCPWMKERIEAGVIDYPLAVDESFAEHLPLRQRLKSVMALYPQSFWKDKAHEQRFAIAQAIFGYYRRRNTPDYYAALYLLTSDDELFRRTIDCVNKRCMDFRYAYLPGIDTENYALYKIAKCIYTQSAEVSVDELADPELVRMEQFRLVVNAMLLKRYGLSALLLTESGERYGCMQS